MDLQVAPRQHRRAEAVATPVPRARIGRIVGLAEGDHVVAALAVVLDVDDERDGPRLTGVAAEPAKAAGVRAGRLDAGHRAVEAERVAGAAPDDLQLTLRGVGGLLCG